LDAETDRRRNRQTQKPTDAETDRRRKECTMDEHQHQHETPAQGKDPSTLERVAQATQARVDEWSSDVVVDLGDSHEKGEPSLCVGEAA
jgi:hypothetical protein